MGISSCDDKKFTVYAHVSPNGKAYVGMTSQPLKTRWGKKGGGYRHQYFYEAIKAIGWDNFQHIVIAEGLSIEEAALKEKEYIKKYNSYKDGFNCSLGGENIIPYHHSKKTKDKISKNRKGICCGKSNAMYGKPLRDRFSTDEDYKRWKQNISNALSMRKEIMSPKYICINTGELFKTAKDAAARFGIKSSHCIVKACDNNTYCSSHYDSNGRYLHFDYYEEGKTYLLNDYVIRRSRSPIICFPSKECYCSTKEIEKCLGISGDTVISICKRKQYANQYDFMYYSDYCSHGYAPKQHPYRAVICLETLEVFDYLTEASKKTGCAAEKISDCCKGKTNGVHSKDGNDYLWQYYDEYLVSPKDISKKSVRKAKRAVICLTTGKTFDSSAAADRYYELGKGSVNNCCRGLYSYSMTKEGTKLEWVYIE